MYFPILYQFLTILEMSLKSTQNGFFGLFEGDSRESYAWRRIFEARSGFSVKNVYRNRTLKSQNEKEIP